MSEVPLNEKLLTAFFDGELTGQKRAQAEKMLAENPQYQPLLRQWQDQAEAVRSLPKFKLDAQFADRVMQKIAVVGTSSTIDGKTGAAAAAELSAQAEPAIMPAVNLAANWRTGMAAIAALAAMLLLTLFVFPNMSDFRPVADLEGGRLADRPTAGEPAGPRSSIHDSEGKSADANSFDGDLGVGAQTAGEISFEEMKKADADVGFAGRIENLESGDPKSEISDPGNFQPRKGQAPAAPGDFKSDPNDNFKLAEKTAGKFQPNAAAPEVDEALNGSFEENGPGLEDSLANDGNFKQDLQPDAGLMARSGQDYSKQKRADADHKATGKATGELAAVDAASPAGEFGVESAGDQIGDGRGGRPDLAGLADARGRQAVGGFSDREIANDQSASQALDQVLFIDMQHQNQPLAEVEKVFFRNSIRILNQQSSLATADNSIAQGKDNSSESAGQKSAGKNSKSVQQDRLEKSVIANGHLDQNVFANQSQDGMEALYVVSTASQMRRAILELSEQASISGYNVPREQFQENVSNAEGIRYSQNQFLPNELQKETRTDRSENHQSQHKLADGAGHTGADKSASADSAAVLSESGHSESDQIALEYRPQSLAQQLQPYALNRSAEDLAGGYRSKGGQQRSKQPEPNQQNQEEIEEEEVAELNRWFNQNDQSGQQDEPQFNRYLLLVRTTPGTQPPPSLPSFDSQQGVAPRLSPETDTAEASTKEDADLLPSRNSER